MSSPPRVALLHVRYDSARSRLHVTGPSSLDPAGFLRTEPPPAGEGFDLAALEARVLDGFDQRVLDGSRDLVGRAGGLDGDPLARAVRDAVEAEVTAVFLRPALYRRWVTLELADAIRAKLGDVPVRGLRATGLENIPVDPELLRRVLREGVEPDRASAAPIGTPTNATERGMGRATEGGMATVGESGITTATARGIVTATAGGIVAAALAVGADLAAALQGRLRGWSTRPPSGPLAREVAVVYSADATHTRHVRDYVARREPGSAPVLVLRLLQMQDEGAPAWARGAQGGAAHVVVPFRVRHVLPGAMDLARVLPRLVRLYAAARRRLGAGMSLRSAVVVLSRLHRGMMYRRWLAGTSLAWDRPVLFGLSVGGDAVLLDRALQARGATTVHWLHGSVGSSLAYRAFSSVCLTDSPRDAAIMSELGTYGACIALPRAPEASETAADAHPGTPASLEGSVLLLTNHLHPAAVHSPLFGLQATLELMDRVATFASERGAPGVAWRPHPREREAGPFFRTAEARARARGWTVSLGSRLDDDLEAASFVVCTPSTVLADAARLGRVAAVHVGVPLVARHLLESVPEALTFADARELGEVYDRLADPEVHARLLTALRRDLNLEADPLALDRVLEGLPRSLATVGPA